MVFHNLLHKPIVISITVGIKITSYDSKYTCVRQKSRLKGPRRIIEKQTLSLTSIVPCKILQMLSNMNLRCNQNVIFCTHKCQRCATANHWNCLQWLVLIFFEGVCDILEYLRNTGIETTSDLNSKPLHFDSLETKIINFFIFSIINCLRHNRRWLIQLKYVTVNSPNNCCN